MGDSRGPQRPSGGSRRAGGSLSSRFTLDGGWQGRGSLVLAPPGTVSSQTWQGERPSWAAVCPPGKAPARSKRKRPAKQPPGRLKGLSQKPSPGAERPGCSALTPGPGADVLLLRGGGGPQRGPQGPSQCTSCFLGKCTCFFQSDQSLGSWQTCVVRPQAGMLPPGVLRGAGSKCFGLREPQGLRLETRRLGQGARAPFDNP